METQANVFYKYKNGVSMRISIGKLINLHLFHSPELEKKTDCIQNYVKQVDRNLSAYFLYFNN